MRIRFREIPRNFSNSAKNAGFSDFRRFRGMKTDSPIHSNHIYLYRIVSEINGDFGQKPQILRKLVTFNAPAECVPLRIFYR